MNIKAIITSFKNNVLSYQYAGSHTDSKPSYIDDGKKSISHQVSESGYNVISNHNVQLKLVLPSKVMPFGQKLAPS